MINISEIISNGGKIVTILVIAFLLAVFIWCTIMITSQIEGQGFKYTSAVSFLLISVLFASFFIGMGVFAGYIEFTHERRAGTIVFFGKSRC